MCAHFVILYIFLLVFLAMALCTMKEFDIIVACMFGEFGVEHMV